MTKERRLSFLMIGLCITVAMFSCASYGGDIKNRFFEAENCYQSLQENSEKKQHRSSWQRCIDGFWGVYLSDPAGAWAPAGLYRTGLLYKELYQHSGRDSDQRQAIDLLQQVSRRYPESSYCDRARKKLSELSKEAPTKIRRIQRKTESKAGMRFFKAEACEKDLRKNPQKKKYRSFWKNCIGLFEDAYHYDPSGAWAAAALYRAGTLYSDLYRYSYRNADQEEGVLLFKKIISEHSGSAYQSQAVAALEAIAADGRSEAAQITSALSREEHSRVEESVEPMAAKTRGSENGIPVSVYELRFWSNPTYTRVVIDASNPTDYTHNVLNEDKKHDKPRRLYVDLQNSRLNQDLDRTVSIDDKLLKDVRVGQFQPDTVRVVVDIKSFHDYKIFSLRDPFRIVVDVSGQAGETVDDDAAADNNKPAGSGEQPASLAAQLGLNVKRIVIDPGHGGRDGGAPGFLKGVNEKHLVLQMAQKLARMIRRELGCEVILTRDSDTFLTLEERTAIANMKNADLFISLHTNASMNRQAHGVETYILNLATDEDAMRVAARENSTSRKNISDLQTILKDLMQNTKINESSRLAGFVQEEMVGHLTQHYNGIKNKGVKQAPFYVLLGAQMPAILIEAGFISNSQEGRRLTQGDYQTRVCEGIVKGIKAYMENTKAAAFIQTQEG